MSCVVWGLIKEECEAEVIEISHSFPGINDQPRLFLSVANEREGTWPWYDSVEFDDMDSFYKFAAFVRETEERIKNAEKDKWGFPILEERP